MEKLKHLEYNEMLFTVRFLHREPQTPDYYEGMVDLYLPVGSDGSLHPVWCPEEGKNVEVAPARYLYPNIGWRVTHPVDARKVPVYSAMFSPHPSAVDVAWCKLVEGTFYHIVDVERYLRKRVGSGIPGPQVNISVTLYLPKRKKFEFGVVVHPDADMRNTLINALLPSEGWDVFHPLLAGGDYKTDAFIPDEKLSEVHIASIPVNASCYRTNFGDKIDGTIIAIERRVRGNAKAALPLNGDIRIHFPL